MSAFICSDKHIATMSVYIAALHGNGMNAQDLADKLKAINIDSVNHRYSHHKQARRNKCKIAAAIEIGANDFAVLFDCWKYQSCEKHSLEYQIIRGFLEFYADKGNKSFSKIQWDI